MAEAAPLTKHMLAGKLVQEIAKSGDHVPEKYLRKDGFPEAIDASNLWRNDLLIDMSLLSSSSTSELAKLRSALSQWGFFQVINHGIESSFLKDLMEAGKQFFALPLEEKLKCFVEDDVGEGYGSDALYTGNQIPNWNDRLFLTLYPKERIRHQCWPQKPEKIRAMINEYSRMLTEVNKVICKAMARSLNLEENCFDFGKQGPTKVRFNLYPRCPCPARVLGARPHSDISTITYLLPENEVEGLQLLKDNQWYKVAVIPDALVINFGDIGEVITNGVFKSGMHRVSTNSTRDRISVAAFFHPATDEQIVEPLSELVGSNQPQLYKKFNISEYLSKFYEGAKQGSRAIDAFRI